MGGYALDVDGVCEESLGCDFLAELECCDFVGVAKTAEYVCGVGVTECCLDGSLAFSGGK